MRESTLKGNYPNVRVWLQADIRSPEIEVCFTPESGRNTQLSSESAFDPSRTNALTEATERWSLTVTCDRLVKIGAKIVCHGRYLIFKMAEVAVPRILFAEILRLIAELRPSPVPAPG